MYKNKSRSVSMTRQHFEFLAGVLQPALRDGAVTLDFVEELSRKLKDTNPSYDQGKFLEACGA